MGMFSTRQDSMQYAMSPSGGTALPVARQSRKVTVMSEIIFEVKDAVACYFDDEEESPRVIRLHFVRDEVLAR